MPISSKARSLIVFVARALLVLGATHGVAALSQGLPTAATTVETPVYVIEAVVQDVRHNHRIDHQPLPLESAADQTKDAEDGEKTFAGRRRRSSDRPSTSRDVTWRVAIENQLNDIRRTIAASNMQYASWDEVLEASVSTLVRSCKVQTKVDVPSQYAGSSGLAGLMNPASDVSSELRQVYLLGPDNRNNQQLIQWSMTGFACAVGEQLCSALDQRTNKTTSVKLFACLFAYSRPQSPNLYAYNGVKCSLCDTDSLWCDKGLCRGHGSCSANDARCRNCMSSCSECQRMSSTVGCQCICYYDSSLSGNGTRRCSESSESSSYQPMCMSSDDFDVETGSRHARVVSIVIGVSLALLVFSSIMFIGYRVNWCRRIPTIRSTENAHYNDVTCGGSTIFDHDTSGVQFSGTPIVAPPPYNDNKPPPAYNLNGTAPSAPPSFYEVSSSTTNHQVLANSITADIGVASMASTEPDLLTTSTSGVYDNVAYSMEDEQ